MKAHLLIKVTLPLLLVLNVAAAVPDSLETVLPDSILRLLEDSSTRDAETWIENWEQAGGNSPASEAVETTPNAAAKLTLHRSAPGRTSVRSRVVVNDEYRYPASYLRFRTRFPRWSFGALASSDRNEYGLTDLWRVYGAYNDGRYRIVAGDFLVNAALGWTIRVAPSLLASYAANAPMIRFSDGIRSNLSSEEGRGWRGLAGAWRAGDWYAGLWSGYSEYDARLENNGAVFYSTQGDHDSDRERDILLITEHHTGGRIIWSGTPGISIGSTAWFSDWDRTPAGDSQPIRFRGSDDLRAVTGMDFNMENMRGLHFRGEVVRQDETTWGGAAQITVQGKGRILALHSYRATAGFRPLHARPFLPFGNDPVGRGGGYLGAETSFDSWIIGGWWAMERREPLNNALSIVETDGGRLYALGPLSSTISADFRALFREDRTATVSTPSRSVRARIFTDQPSFRQGIRLERSWRNDGGGLLAALEHREKLSRRLTLSGTFTFIKQYGDGAPVVVIEPSGPGLLPVRRVAQNQVRTALFASFDSPGSLFIWGRVEFIRATGADPSGDPLSYSPDSVEWTIGADWKF